MSTAAGRLVPEDYKRVLNIHLEPFILGQYQSLY
jgi:hypothetical protein